MTDLSKPILLGGLAAMFFIIVLCFTVTIGATTYYAGYTYYTAMTPGGAAAAGNAVKATASPAPTLPAEPTGAPATATAVEPAVRVTEPLKETAPASPAPSATPAPPTQPPPPTEPPLPTPDFAATALQATQAAALAEEQPEAAETPEEVTDTGADVSAAGASPEMQAVIQDLSEQGLLQSTSGTFYTVPDYEDTWNTIDWQRWTYVEQAPDNFIIRARASWNTTAVAGMTANSGCGFVFRENGEENYYLIYLGINGRVYFYRMKDGAIKYVGNSIYYPVGSPEGEADIMLYVNDIRFIFGVDGEIIYDMMDGFFTTGKLGLTTLSGTAQGDGTTCRMQNIELWAIE